MRFGLLCTAQADARELGPETGQGFRDYLDFNVEAEALGLHSSFLVEHHFTGWNQVSATLMLLTCLAMRTTTLRLGHRGDDAALAQPGPARRAGRDARSRLRRPARLRRRQGLPAHRVQGLRRCAGGGRGALRRGARGHPAVLDHAHALLASGPLLAVRGHRGRAADRAAAASADLGRGRERAVDPPRRRARLQSHSRSIRRRPRRSANASRSTAANARRRARRSIRCRWRWRASSTSRGRGRQAGGARPAGRTPTSACSPCRARPTARPARTSSPTRTCAGETERNALVGTPDEICRGLEALHKAGAEYVLLTILGGREQLRRFRPRDHAGVLRCPDTRCGSARGMTRKPTRASRDCWGLPIERVLKRDLIARASSDRSGATRRGGQEGAMFIDRRGFLKASGAAAATSFDQRGCAQPGQAGGQHAARLAVVGQPDRRGLRQAARLLRAGRHRAAASRPAARTSTASRSSPPGASRSGRSRPARR